MGNKIFRIAYFIFVAVLLVLLILSATGVIYFGVELSNQLTRIEIIIGIIISIPVFILINRLRGEDFGMQFLRAIVILIMLAIIIFGLLNDISFHQYFG